jgi:YVTN family beta-propeller protein
MTFARKAASRIAAAVLSIGLVFAVGCGDVYRPIANPITQPGGDPQNREIVALVNSNPADAPGSATFIDVSGDANIGNQTAGKGVTRASFDTNLSALYIPNPGSNNISYILNIYGSTTTTITNKITVTANSNPVAIFPGSTAMYTMNTGKVPNCTKNGSVGVIENSSQTLSQDICVGASPVWATFATGQNLLFVLDSVENSVYVIYTPQNAVKAVLPVGTAPVWSALSHDGNFLFVVNKGSSDISVIDVNALTVASTTVPTGGTSPVYGFLDSKLNKLYVVNQGSKNVSGFDASNPLALTSLHAPATTGTNPTRVSGTPDGLRLFVPNAGTNTVTQIDTGSFLSTTISIDSTLQVTDAAVAKNGTKLYVSAVSADDKSNQTLIYRTTDGTLVTSLPAPQQDASTCEFNPATCTGPQRQRPLQIVGPN